MSAHKIYKLFKRPLTATTAITATTASTAITATTATTATTRNFTDMSACTSFSPRLALGAGKSFLGRQCDITQY